MHPFVARLLLVSLGSCELLGCAESLLPPRANRAPQPFDVLQDTHPDIVADAYAGSDLKTKTVQLPAERCRAACGPATTGCDASVQVTGAEARPSQMTGQLQCYFPSSGGGGGWDPFGLNSCPFGCGRRPRSVEVARSVDHADPLVGHVAAMARLEALSVGAFAQLARDVRAHAPRFLRHVRRAQRDERRHAHLACGLLRELGGTPARVPRVPLVARNLEEAAVDNAIEGCVHETFGAIALTHQAERAQHPSIRRFFASIAADEIDHAVLSWEVHDALSSELPSSARATITELQLRALAQIEDMRPLSDSTRAHVGGPSFDERRTLVRAMRDSIMSTSGT